LSEVNPGFAVTALGKTVAPYQPLSDACTAFGSTFFQESDDRFKAEDEEDGDDGDDGNMEDEDGDDDDDDDDGGDDDGDGEMGHEGDGNGGEEIDPALLKLLLKMQLRREKVEWIQAQLKARWSRISRLGAKASTADTTGPVLYQEAPITPRERILYHLIILTPAGAAPTPQSVPVPQLVKSHPKKTWALPVIKEEGAVTITKRSGRASQPPKDKFVTFTEPFTSKKGRAVRRQRERDRPGGRKAPASGKKGALGKGLSAVRAAKVATVPPAKPVSGTVSGPVGGRLGAPVSGPVTAPVTGPPASSTVPIIASTLYQ
jgi:hypothetical protein